MYWGSAYTERLQCGWKQYTLSIEVGLKLYGGGGVKHLLNHINLAYENKVKAVVSKKQESVSLNTPKHLLESEYKGENFSILCI